MSNEGLISETKGLNDYVKKVDEDLYEIHICKWCSHSEVISKIPFNRHKKRNRQYSLYDNIAIALSRYCEPYGSINNGLSILLHKVKEIEGEQ